MHIQYHHEQELKGMPMPGETIPVTPQHFISNLQNK